MDFETAIIGTHITKRKTFLESLVSFYHDNIAPNEYKLPVQIFSGSVKSWKRSARNAEDENNTREYIKQNGIKMFIHSIYFINLARRAHKESLDSLNYELELCSALGGKGVVVHVGKAVAGLKNTLAAMEYNIATALDWVKDDCPLLLETPAGQGTEMLTTKEDFLDFVLKFDQRLGVCVDTCHVFASGYDPYDYLVYMHENRGVNLVHMNDSECPQGSRKDRHAPLGKGKIHFEILSKCISYCESHEIPMIIE